MLLSNSLQTHLINKKLKEIDPEFQYSLICCSNSILYEYSGEWKKCKVEGTLFVYSSSKISSKDCVTQKDNYSLIILSRDLNVDHFILKLENFKVDCVNGLIVLTINSQIFGLWLEKDVCESVFSLLDQLTEC